MLEHPTTRQLEEYNRRTLAPEIFMVVHHHVSLCPVCEEKCDPFRRASDDYENLWQAVKPQPSDQPYHLSYEEVVGYVNEELGEIDLEIVETHLEDCAACREDIVRMREVKAEAESEKSAGVVVEPSLTHAPPTHKGFDWTSLFSSRTLRVAATLVLFVGLASLLLLFRQNRIPTNARRESQALPTATGSSPETVQDVPPSPNQNGAPSQDQTAQEGESSKTLELQDGDGSIALDKEGRIEGLEKLPEHLQQTVRSALIEQRILEPRGMAELSARPGTLLGESSDGLPFRLREPVGKVVQNTRPVFRWEPLAGAQSYRVIITDAQLNEVAASGPLTTTTWKTPRTLKPGETYSWQVSALKDGAEVRSPVMPAGQAKFRIADARHMEVLRRARMAYPRSHLLAGLLYARAGLLDDAEREFQMLSRANPQSSIARKLLGQVRSLKRRL